MVTVFCIYNGIFHKATYNKVRMVHCVILRDCRLQFPKNTILLSLLCVVLMLYILVSNFSVMG